MNYIPLIVFFIAMMFYYIIRLYFKKYKSITLPLLPERYYDNPYINILQAIIIMLGIIIGTALLYVLNYIFELNIV